MKLETTAGLLKAALNAVKHAIEKRNTIPVLTMVKIDGRTIEATNLDMWIKVDVPAKVARGTVCVPFFPLMGLIGHVPVDDAVVIEGDNEGVTVAFGLSSYDLPAADPVDFPACEALDVPVLKIDGGALKRALAYVAPSISTEGTRYYLNGVRVEGSVAVATDGHRLASHPLGFSLGDEAGIVPVEAVKALMALPDATGLQLDGAKCRFAVKMPGVSIAGKLIDGTFPDWRRVVPTFQNQYSELRADKTRLIQILRRLDAVDPSARTVTIAWQDDVLAAVMRRVDTYATGRGFGREEMDIPVASLGGGSRFSVNVRYFISALRLINRDEVEIRMQDAGAPMVLRGDGEAFMVVMPMRGAEESAQQAAAMLTAAAKRKLTEVAA